MMSLNVLDSMMETTRTATHARPKGHGPAATLPIEISGDLQRVAATPSTVLLGGETGTGKTHLARIIHELSPRRDQPILVVNCASLSESLIESELFGHVRGAFTGAERDRNGKLHDVGEGTLLLDEVDCLPPALQAKLLRVLEERLFEPVGSNRTEPFRARLIVASNRPLEQEVAAGRFRGDLFYRINVVSLQMPPLRERRTDIPDLIRGFLGDQPGSIRIDEEALTALVRYEWPGNIRELRNVLERARIFARGHRITLAELPVAIAVPAPVVTPEFVAVADALVANPFAPPAHAPYRTEPGAVRNLAESRQMVEREQILHALRTHGNNRSLAARTLGISRVCLYKKIHRYGIPLKQPRPE